MDMNTTPTLIYWDAAGRGEPIRMACHLGKFEYNDERISMQEFRERKAAGEFPLGSVPVWVEDGVKYVQSSTILRMIGMRTGQYPTSDASAAWAIDSVMEAVEDTMAAHKVPYVRKLVMGSGDPGQEELDGAIKFTENICKLVERRLTAHGKQYVAGDKCTVADLKLCGAVHAFQYNDEMPMPAEHRETLKAVATKYPKAQQYFESTMMEALAGYYQVAKKVKF